MKITIYELLGLIKDNKAPLTIKICGYTYCFNKELKDYEDIETGDLLFEDTYDFIGKYLNDTAEIIEEENRIPEKIEYNDGNLIKNHIALANFNNDFYLADKINEIIDYLESKEDE